MIGDKGVGDYSARMKRMIRNKILNNGNVISSWTRNKLLWKRDRGGVQGFIFHFHRWERVETAPERFCSLATTQQQQWYSTHQRQYGIFVHSWSLSSDSLSGDGMTHGMLSS
jgi:hypothetical protein